MSYLSYKTFFTTLGNPNRLKIIHFLAQHGPRKVQDIVRGTRLEQTAVSHNLQRLLTCQFVHLRRQGRERVYSINEKTIKPLLALLDKHVKKYCEKVCEFCGDHSQAKQRAHHAMT